MDLVTSWLGKGDSDFQNRGYFKIALGFGTGVLGAYTIYRVLKKKAKLPPGPRGVPLLGNVWGWYA